MSGVGTIRVYRPDPSLIERSEQRGRAIFSTRELAPSLRLVTAQGDIDATNGRELGRYVESHTTVSSHLILDLSGLTFFGAQGFSALHYISVSCTRNDVDWVLVAGAEVSRLLRICDADGVLPAEDSRESALSRLRKVPRGRHLITRVG